MFNKHYRTGLHVGAEAVGDWGPTRYEALARELWAKVTAPYAVVSVTKNGATFLVSPYDNKTEASDHYGTTTDNPGKAAYVAYFDRNVKAGENPLIDSAFFQPTEVVTEKVVETIREVKSTTKAAWGIGLAGALGLLMLVAKH